MEGGAPCNWGLLDGRGTTLSRSGGLAQRGEVSRPTSQVRSRLGLSTASPRGLALQGCGVPASPPCGLCPPLPTGTGHRARAPSDLRSYLRGREAGCLETALLASLSVLKTMLRSPSSQTPFTGRNPQRRAHTGPGHAGAAVGSRRPSPQRQGFFCSRCHFPESTCPGAPPLAAGPWRAQTNSPLRRNQQRVENSHRALGPKERAGGHSPATPLRNQGSPPRPPPVVS